MRAAAAPPRVVSRAYTILICYSGVCQLTGYNKAVMVRVALAASLILVSFVLPAKASAHIIATDGGMEVTLHIDQEDYPVVNVPQVLIFIYGEPPGSP